MSMLQVLVGYIKGVNMFNPMQSSEYLKDISPIVAANTPMPLWQTLGLNQSPFMLTPDFITLPQHVALSAQLQRHLKSSAITLLLGEEGMGKSAFAKAFYRRHIKSGVWIQGTKGVTLTNILKSVALSTHQKPPSFSTPKDRQLYTLKRAIENYADSFTIVVDDADQLPLTSLAALVHLIAHETELSLSILLIGQSHLKERIEGLTMQGEQGIKIHTLRCSHWQKKDICLFAQERMKQAGWQGAFPKLPKKFWENLQLKTGGLPGHVNQVLHHHLLAKIATLPKAISWMELMTSKASFGFYVLMTFALAATKLPERCIHISDNTVRFLLNCVK